MYTPTETQVKAAKIEKLDLPQSHRNFKGRMRPSAWARFAGRLKVATSLPIYEPAREKVIYANVRAANKGPLPDIELTHIYERIIDVMRALQKDELASKAGETGK